MKKYVYLLIMAFLAIQIQSCSNGDESEEMSDDINASTRLSQGNKINGGHNTPPDEGPMFYLESPSDMKVVPEELTIKAEGGTDSITIYVSFDINDNAYERTVSFDFADKKAEPWLTGEWVDNKYLVTAEKNDSGDPRTVILTFNIFNGDKSVNLEAKALVIQEAVDVASVEPTLLEFPAEGGAKYVKYTWGGFKWMNRQLTDAGKEWIKPAWSYDYYDENRFPREMYVHIGPNTTDKARQDTIKMGFTLEEGSDFDTRFIIPVVIKQAAGPYSPKDAKSIIVGKWHHYIIGTNALTGKPYTECNYDVVFNVDGTYREDQHEVGINRDYKFEGWEQGTYEITKVLIDDKNCLRVYLNQKYTYGPTTAEAGYSSGSRETYFVVYPHFLLWATGRSRYYDRVE